MTGSSFAIGREVGVERGNFKCRLLRRPGSCGAPGGWLLTCSITHASESRSADGAELFCIGQAIYNFPVVAPDLRPMDRRILRDTGTDDKWRPPTAVGLVFGPFESAEK
jgi:hypothetical protein